MQDSNHDHKHILVEIEYSVGHIYQGNYCHLWNMTSIIMTSTMPQSIASKVAPMGIVTKCSTAALVVTKNKTVNQRLYFSTLLDYNITISLPEPSMIIPKGMQDFPFPMYPGLQTHS